jgi:ABC-type antimicrobial peptide transport system, permease component
VFALLLLLGLLILISLLFSAIVQERYRELSLLRAMGARPNQIMSVILTEAAAITLLGGLFGLGFGASLVFVFARTLGFYFETIGVPFAWPPIWMTVLAAAVAVVSPRSSALWARSCLLAGTSSGALHVYQSRGDALILRADGLRKSYATGVVAVSHAELKLEDGEFISIVGRSGSESRRCWR